jgi:transposase
MKHEPTITTERVDDIPLLIAQMKRMELATVIDRHILPHGNREGLSLGQTTVVWLAHILSQADHRLNQVRPWVESLKDTLARSLDTAFSATDFTDDRLAALLRYFSLDHSWHAIEADLATTLVRVYDPLLSTIRLDTTTASGYWSVSDDGLFQFGHSKDHRPDLPQLKLMLATLDPWALPLACDVVSGQRADDPLYLPIISRLQTALGRSGLRFVGDCKMSALLTRAQIAADHNYYLSPLSERQTDAAWLDSVLQELAAQPEQLRTVSRTDADGEHKQIASGVERSTRRSAVLEGGEVNWDERLLLVCSHAHREAAIAALSRRIEQAIAEIEAVALPKQGKPGLLDQAALEEAIAALLRRHEVSGLIEVQARVRETERTVRGYKGRPERVERGVAVSVQAVVKEEARAKAERRLGWRVYVTNEGRATLGLEDAVLLYREEYLIEQAIGRLKGAPLTLRPVYLSREEHVVGLVRLLTLALRVLAVLEGVVRRGLGQCQEALSGLYAGAPKRSTARPRAERLLAAFGNLTLTVVTMPEQVIRHLTPLSSLQQRILHLLNLPPTIYTDLCHPEHIPKSPE